MARIIECGARQREARAGTTRASHLDIVDRAPYVNWANNKSRPPAHARKRALCSRQRVGALLAPESGPPARAREWALCSRQRVGWAPCSRQTVGPLFAPESGPPVRAREWAPRLRQRVGPLFAPESTFMNVEVQRMFRAPRTTFGPPAAAPTLQQKRCGQRGGRVIVALVDTQKYDQTSSCHRPPPRKKITTRCEERAMHESQLGVKSLQCCLVLFRSAKPHHLGPMVRAGMAAASPYADTTAGHRW